MVRVVSIIDARSWGEAPGTREMPVWGHVFEASLADRAHVPYTVLRRDRLLAEYLRTLQR
jgi:hypothetical protein